MAEPRSIKLPCPRCSGVGYDTVEDRHFGTISDVCPACGGEGVVLAQTGERRESSFATTRLAPRGGRTDG